MNQARRSTAIHEAGHVVVSYALGRRVMRAVLTDDRKGEVVQLCSACDTCNDYYSDRNPATDSHSKLIQDDLRCDMAIAMAGEIAERTMCGDCYIDEHELRQDSEFSRCRASAIHRWIDLRCWRERWWEFPLPCRDCEAYLKVMKQAVQKIIADPLIKSCIEKVASQLENCQQIDEKQIDELLNKEGLRKRAALGLLPVAPG